MSTKKVQAPLPPEPVEEPLTLQELGGLLVKHYGITEGKYELLVEFKIGIGAFGSSPEERTPGAMIGVSKIGLVQAKIDGPLTIDASTVAK